MLWVEFWEGITKHQALRIQTLKHSTRIYIKDFFWRDCMKLFVLFSVTLLLLLNLTFPSWYPRCWSWGRGQLIKTEMELRDQSPAFILSTNDLGLNPYAAIDFFRFPNTKLEAAGLLICQRKIASEAAQEKRYDSVKTRFLGEDW